MLVIPSDGSGCGYHRSIWPHQYIQEHYGDEFDIDIVYLNDILQEKDVPQFFGKYDLVHIHKQLDRNCELINMLEFMSVPFIIDLDDNWALGNDHPMAVSARRGGWAETIQKHAKAATYVTTTTSLYAKQIARINKNVAIFPNAINPDIPQFNQTKNKSDKIRFGLICGSTHWKDIELMQGINALSKDILDKVQFCLCGFDTRGTTTIFNKATGESTSRPIRPEESVWCRYEEFLTNNYKNVTPEHAAFLKKYMAGVDDPFTDDSYRRFWTRDIQHYATHYQNVDVLLAPLKENDFNKMKSFLKFSECGFTDTAIIASNFGPYTLCSTPYLEKGNVINPNGNCLLVDPSKNRKQWVKYIKYLVEHPDVIETLKSNLSKDQREKYSMANICKERVELYKKIVSENKK